MLMHVNVLKQIILSIQLKALLNNLAESTPPLTHHWGEEMSCFPVFSKIEKKQALNPKQTPRQKSKGLQKSKI